MPDIDFQKIVLNLIPKKDDEPVIFYASQYETTRPFIADLMWGDTEFAPGDDCWAEIDIRKNDDNLVVITDDVAIDNNEVSVILPVQAVTCIGNNLGQIKIYAADDQLIAALNFILHVQPDPLAGGVTSETDIDNLTQQIEDIATEVIGENYYDKTEVDALLNDKADVSDLPDMSQYYTKTATDTLLSAKADTATTYTKSETDSLLSAKANTADLATVATTGDYDDLLNKPVLPDMTQYYTKAEVDAIVDDIFPTFTASGDIATFTTALTKPLVSVTADPLATTITRCGINFWDEEIELGILNSDGSVDTSYTTRMVTKNFVPVVGDQTYAFVFNTNFGKGRGAWYDANKNLIQYIGDFPTTPTIDGRYALETAPVGACYLKYCFTPSYGTTYLNDTSLNYPADNTYYEATKGVISVSKDIATSIESVSGTNNVFADAGSVTVQYKYMSI